MAKIVVNSALTVKEAGIFFDYLKAQMSLNHCYFHDIVQHDIEMKLPDTFVIKYTIVFPQPVLCRDLSSPKDKKPTSFRVDFVDSKIGEGQYGQVYSISSTFDFDGHSFKPVLFSYPLAVKIQQHCQCLSEQCSSECKQHNPILLLNNEYDRSIRTAHLKWQPPVFYSKTKASFSVMQRFPAETLSKCLKNDCQGIAILSFDQRMHLTRQLILAVKHQVTDLGMIHRDLKPGNIMVSLAENQVNLIDYQYAQFLEPGQSGILTTSYAGTHNYLPKEFFDSNPKDLEEVAGVVRAGFGRTLDFSDIYAHVTVPEEVYLLRNGQIKAMASYNRKIFSGFFRTDSQGFFIPATIGKGKYRISQTNKSS